MLWRYGAAILSVAAASLVRVLFQALLGVSVPFITFFPGVVFAAWIGGLGPGIFAALLSVFTVSFIFAPPFLDVPILSRADIPRTAISLPVRLARWPWWKP